MNKEEFLNVLERLLDDIPAEERGEAMDYYRGYFEDAGEENEAAVIEELGSPQEIAASICEGMGTGESYVSSLKNPPQVQTDAKDGGTDADAQGSSTASHTYSYGYGGQTKTAGTGTSAYTYGQSQAETQSGGGSSSSGDMGYGTDSSPTNQNHGTGSSTMNQGHGTGSSTGNSGDKNDGSTGSTGYKKESTFNGAGFGENGASGGPGYRTYRAARSRWAEMDRNKRTLVVIAALVILFGTGIGRGVLKIALGLVGGVIGLIGGLIGVGVAVLAVLFAGSVGGVVGGIACVAVGIAKLCSLAMAKGMLITGIGMLLIALGGICMILMILVAAKLIPWAVRTVTALIQRLIRWGRGITA